MTASAKAALRAQALAARGKGGDQAALTANLVQALVPYQGATLSGYWPMRDEADVRPAMQAHTGRLCLPVVTGKAVPLIFREWNGGPLERGSFGTSHPADSAAILIPSVLLVPLAGFDRQGNRIGYGGGYYDRTLEILRNSDDIAAIGVAFAVQELPHIPNEPFDQRLDMIVTDQDIIIPR